MGHGTFGTRSRVADRLREQSCSLRQEMNGVHIRGPFSVSEAAG